MIFANPDGIADKDVDDADNEDNGVLCMVEPGPF